MSYHEEGYKTMLSNFRTNDLQILLGAFGRNKSGRKSELKERAIDLLRTRPTGFNQAAYLSKIVEIYRSIQSDTPNNNDILRNMMHNQQQRQMMSMSMPTQQQRMYSTSQYAQQPIHTMTRTGMPQTMPQMQRGMYPNMTNNSNISGTSNIQYNYQPTNSRNGPPFVSQSSVSHHLNMIPPDQGAFDLNAGASIANSNFLPPTQSLSNIQLRKLPFYNVIDDAIKPIILVGQDRCTLPNYPRGMKEAMFKLCILPRHAQEICLDRDMSNGKAEYYTQLQIRICLLESGATEITDCMPLGLHIRVNNKACPLPPTAPNTRPGTEARRTPRPINCTHQMKLNPIVSNSIVINWNPDGKTYVLGMYLVKKLSSDILLQRLKDKGARSAEETKSNIIKKLADVDPDLATTSYRFSLVCPLGKMRMTIPAKSINCDHLQCFDASIFILMNEKKPTWMCPTCNKTCFYDDIQIESYFLDIVTNPNLSDCCKEIEILADGTWKVYDETNENKNSEIAVADIKDKAIDSVDLDDSDDGGSDDKPVPESKKESKPESSKDSENLKSSFIDLTLSDEDEAPKEKDKQENEAQAADAIQPAATTVDLKPQAQVQPQQAVTSSEQGVVIEIDSPTPPTSPNPSTSAS